MKKQVLILSLIALFTFSCSDTESELQIEETSVELLEKNLSLTQSMSALMADEEFKDFINLENEKHKLQLKNNGQGIVILNDGYNLGFGAFDPITGTFAVIGGSGKIEELKNGKAKFSIHTNNPEAFLFGPSGEFTSDCVDAPRGVFNFNFISEYIVDIFEPIPGLIFTSYIPTGENSSAETASGHCKISNAVATFNDDYTEIIDCSEATEYKTIRLKGNRNANGGGNGFTITIE